MAFDDLGDALTAPVNAIEGALNLSPTARTALLSFGLQAMQPTAIGQTPMGHIAQAIGQAGEAVTRNELMDQKQDLAEAKLRGMDEKLQLAREGLSLRERTAAANLDVRERALDQRGQQFDRAEQRRASRQIGGLSDQFKTREARMAQQAYERTIAEDAKQAFKANEGIVLDKNHPYAKYKGQTLDQIRDAMKLARPYDPKMSYGSSTPAPDDDDDDGDPVVKPDAQPPVPGARQAADGNWYVPDSKRPGKFLRVLR